MTQQLNKFSEYLSTILLNIRTGKIIKAFAAAYTQFASFHILFDDFRGGKTIVI